MNKPKILVPPAIINEFIQYYHRNCSRLNTSPHNYVDKFLHKATTNPRKLKFLNLQNQNVTDLQLEALAATLQRYYIIRELNLSKNPLRTQGVQALLNTMESQINRNPAPEHESYILCKVKLSGNADIEPALVSKLRATEKKAQCRQCQLLAHHVFKDLCDTDGHLPVKSFKTAVRRLRVAGLVGRIRPTANPAGFIDEDSFLKVVEPVLFQRERLTKVAEELSPPLTPMKRAMKPIMMLMTDTKKADPGPARGGKLHTSAFGEDWDTDDYLSDQFEEVDLHNTASQPDIYRQHSRTRQHQPRTSSKQPQISERQTPLQQKEVNVELQFSGAKLEQTPVSSEQEEENFPSAPDEAEDSSDTDSEPRISEPPNSIPAATSDSPALLNNPAATSNSPALLNMELMLATEKMERMLASPAGEKILKQQARLNHTTVNEARKSIFVRMQKEVKTNHRRKTIAARAAVGLSTPASSKSPKSPVIRTPHSSDKPRSEPEPRREAEPRSRHEPSSKPEPNKPKPNREPKPSTHKSRSKPEPEPTAFGPFSGRRMKPVNSPAPPETGTALVPVPDNQYDDILLYCAVLVVSLRGQSEEAAVSPIMGGKSRWNSSTLPGRSHSRRAVRSMATDTELTTVTTMLCHQTHTTQVFGAHNEMRFECDKEELASAREIKLYGEITSGVLRLGHFQVDVRPMAIRLFNAMQQDAKEDGAFSRTGTDKLKSTLIRRLPVVHHLPSGAEVEAGTVEMSFRVASVHEKAPPPADNIHAMFVEDVHSDQHFGEHPGRTAEPSTPITIDLTHQRFMSAQQIMQAHPNGEWNLVEVLDVSHNNFEVLSPLCFSLPVMRNLRKLCLAHNQMRQLMLDCFSCCPFLEVLDLSENNIKRIGDGLLLSDNPSHDESSPDSGTSALTALTSLNLSGNRLKGVVGLESLRKLKELNLSRNFLAKAMSVRSLSLNSYLTHLWLDGNPMAQSRACRRQVCNLLPKLEQLDDRTTPSYALRMRAEKSSNSKNTAKTRWGGVKRQNYGSVNSSLALTHHSTKRNKQQSAGSQRSLKIKAVDMGSYSRQAQQPTRNNEAMRRLLKPAGYSGRSQRMRMLHCNRWVSIVVSRAENLLNMDGQPADPYITIRHGKVMRQTDTLHHTSNPSWEGVPAVGPSSAIADWSLSSSPPLTVPVMHEANDMPDLEVMAWDEDRRAGDTLLGRTSLKVGPLMREVIKARAHTKRVVTKRFRLRTAHRQKIAPLVVLAFAVGKSAAEAKRAHGPRQAKRTGNANKRVEYLSKPKRVAKKVETFLQTKRTAFGSTFIHDKVKQRKRVVAVPPRPPSMMLRRKPQKNSADNKPAWGAGAGNPVRRGETDLKVEKMNRQITKLSTLHSMAKMKQKKALEKVSEELQRTRVQLASLLAQQEAQARNNVFTLPADRFVQTIKDGAAASGTQTGSRNEHTIDSTEQLVQKTPKSLKMVLSHRLHAWMEDIKEEERTAQIALKVLIRMADEGQHKLHHLKNMERSMRECGMYSEVQVPQYVEQAIADDQSAITAVQAVVRSVSEVRGAIQHLISLLQDQPPFAPEIQDYVDHIRNDNFGRKLIQSTVEEESENEIHSAEEPESQSSSEEENEIPDSPAVGLFDVFRQRRNQVHDEQEEEEDFRSAEEEAQSSDHSEEEEFKPSEEPEESEEESEEELEQSETAESEETEQSELEDSREDVKNETGDSASGGFKDSREDVTNKPEQSEDDFEEEMSEDTGSEEFDESERSGSYSERSGSYSERSGSYSERSRSYSERSRSYSERSRSYSERSRSHSYEETEGDESSSYERDAGAASPKDNFDSLNKIQLKKMLLKHKLDPRCNRETAIAQLRKVLSREKRQRDPQD